MPSLQVRELPQQIYHKLQQEAESEHRSLAQQAVVTLARGLDISLKPASKRKELLVSIKGLSEKLKEFSLSNPAKLVREDRER